MNTLISLAIMVAVAGPGRMLGAFMLFIMGTVAFPGFAIYDVGQRRDHRVLKVLSIALAVAPQAYVAGCLAVFMVSVVSSWPSWWPELPTWPLWIAAYYLALCPMVEHARTIRNESIQSDKDRKFITTMHYSNEFVAIVANLLFFTAIWAPSLIKPLFGWIPMFHFLTM